MMRKKFIVLISFLVLAFTCTSQADVVIGDFEGNMDNWVPGWDDSPVLELSDIGVTSGTGSLALSVSPGWAWALQWNAPEGFDLSKYHTVSADVTWVASEWVPVEDKTGWVQFQLMAVNSGGPSGWQQSNCIDPVNPDSPGSWDPVTWGDQTRTLTWDISQYDSTGTEWLQIIFSVNNGDLTTVGKYYIDNVKLIGAEPEPAPKIIYVTSVKDQNLDEVQDNVSWLDWLTAEGYDVDFRPDYWVEPLDPNKIAELEAADLIIASRGMSTGSYDDDTAIWNGLSTPMICTNAWMIRSNRWVWMNSTAANKDADSPFLLALETTHPVFAGVPLDSDGLVEILDPSVGSGNTSFLNDILDVGNGTLIAQSLGIYNTAWVVEWPAGVEYYDGAGQITGGPRLLFMAGTQDDPYTDENGNIMPVDVLNLNEAGQTMFLNAIEYMLPAKLTHSYTFEDGTGADSVGGADGTLAGDAAIVDGSLVVDGDGDWMEMPGDVIAINTYSALTLELWCTQSVDNPFSMTASLGGTWDNGFGKDYIFIATGRGDQMNRGAIANTPDDAEPWADEVGVSSPELNDGIEHQYVLTITAAELAYYVDGVLIGTAPMGDTTIAGTSNDYVFLGKGIYSVDGTMNCSINEFNIYDKALSAGQIAANYAAGPVSAPVPIAVENASFELPGTEKIKGWNGEGVAGTPAEDIPGWASDTEVTDSGVETGWGATDGEWTAFLRGSDPSAWQLTGHVIGADDVIELKVDGKNNWQATTLQLSLYYDDGGARVTAASVDVTLTDEMQEFSLVLSAADVPDAVGKLLGIELNNVTPDVDSWLGLDNVRLTLN
jgi:hypothetical protein